MNFARTKTDNKDRRKPSWRRRIGIASWFAFTIAVIWITNSLLTERYTQSTRTQAKMRMTLYSGNLISELQRAAIVPQLLAHNPDLINALDTNSHAQTSERLLAYIEEIGAASLLLLDDTGRVVAATNGELLDSNHRSAPYFDAALRSNISVFSIATKENEATTFFYAHKMETADKIIGVIVVEVDLHKFETSWGGILDAVFVTDIDGVIMLSTEPKWLGLTEEQALAVRSAPSAIEWALLATADWVRLPGNNGLLGRGLMRQETPIPFQGWNMTSFTTYASVRQRVNGILATEVMIFAILLALMFYFLSRKAHVQSRFFQEESAELRQLNQRMQREIAERQRVEKNLEVAEQTLAQSSKLAALGEMSAAVSHELSQPLAAMKTYLAGARLLVRRDRPEEAVSSIQRIDDLIERMGEITKQLKSYARKGNDMLTPVDTREAVNSALSMMEPQLRLRNVKIIKTLPREPALVMADRVRIEQVIINLIRNALDATKTVKDPQIEVTLSAGITARLTIADNGPGIEDLDSLFEPFYTTKQAGDGVGLGLAISSGIMNDLGGRLSARNAANGGAVFEVQMPLLIKETKAAE